MIKDQNGRDLTEAEEIKKRWQDYTEELYKKELNIPDNHNGVVTDLEPDILECEVKWALGSLSNNKASGGDKHIIRKTGLDESPVGIKIAGRNINNLRYADDTTLMAESEEELKSLLMRVKEESAKVGLKLNIKKTKIMASGPLTSWQIDGEEMEAYDMFCMSNLKKEVSSNGNDDADVQNIREEQDQEPWAIVQYKNEIASKSLQPARICSYVYTSVQEWEAHAHLQYPHLGLLQAQPRGPPGKAEAYQSQNGSREVDGGWRQCLAKSARN
ncbi:putative uncharacterized transposon-derived protein F52C9.6 [Varanus komodoensis]|nr:putative uncharacterized transposon-derived protein F52C9.6 [Varanus komodoensis]